MGMAINVVDPLKIIDVEKDQGKGRVVAARSAELFFQAVVKILMVINYR